VNSDVGDGEGMTHRLPNEHDKAVGDAYAAREFPGGLEVMFGLNKKKGGLGREGKRKEGKEKQRKRY